MAHCPNPAGIARKLKRARTHEAYKLVWKIFFLERREVCNEVEARVSQVCKLLHSLQKVCIAQWTTKLLDRGEFLKIFGNTSRLSKITGGERAVYLLLKSKLFSKTLKVLHQYHYSTLTTPLPHSTVIRKHSSREGLVIYTERGEKERQKERARVAKPLKRQQEEDRNSSTDGPVTGGALTRPSTLDSVFVGSLSQSSSRSVRPSPQSTKRLPKNRPGQRTRRLQAEQRYGAAARHLRGHQNSESRSDRSRVRRQPSKTQCTPNHPHLAPEIIPSNSNSPNIPVTSHSRSAETNSSSEQLHPSWEASKRRKERETKILQPQGQRIVFEDSD